MKKLNFSNLFFNSIVAMAACFMLSVTPVIGICAAFATGTFLSFAPTSGALMAGLQKEIWTDILLEKFYPDNSFISEARDMSALVDNNKINLAEAGADPAVLIDNTSYPIAVYSRIDVPHDLTLKTLDTESTVVRNAEAMELSYDKMASVISGHKKALLKAACRLAAWNYAPSSNADLTPVLKTTGANLSGFKRMTFKDILDLSTKFNNMDLPGDGRILVLNPFHEADLIAEDMERFKAVLVNNMLFGFKLYRTSVTPTFNKTTGVKCAFGAAAAADTDTRSSFAFHKDEVMKAMGTIDMFSLLKDPANKGDIVNFQMRYCALPMRQTAIAAIYSADATEA